MRRYLYRGVSDVQHRQGIALHPRNTKPFIAPALFDVAPFDVNTFGDSSLNAAIDHVHGTDDKRLSGISTTTSKSVAKEFARNGGRGGWIYTFSVARIKRLGIEQVAMWPILAPDDSTFRHKEVILYCNPPGPLDERIIVCVER
jgi:hypothetical protein